MRSPVAALATLRGPLAVVAAVSFVSSLGIGVMLPLIPLYAISVGASPLQLGLMTSAFTLTSTAGQLIAGWSMDRIGSLPFTRVGTGVYAIANALIATAQDAVTLVAFRGLAGLGAGASGLGTRVYITQVAPPERMATVSGALAAAGAAGSVLGPAFGAIVVAVFDLRAPFVIVALTSGLALLGLLTLPTPARRAAPPRPGAPLSSLNRSLLTLLVSNVFLSAGYGGLITTFAPYATQMRGWTGVEIALLFSVAGIGSIALGILLGRIADRTGRRRVAVFATIPASLMGFALVFDLARPLTYGVMFLAGGGMAGFTASWFALLNDASPEGRKGRTFSFVTALSNLGAIIGALGATAVWQTLGLAFGVLVASAAMLLAGAALIGLPSTERHAPRVQLG